MSQMRVAYVLKRFPRLSETFVLRELLELERLGLDLVVLALGRAEEATVHADYARLKARVVYADELPEAPAPDAHGGRADSDSRSKEARLARRFVPFVRETGVTHLHAHFATAAADVARRISVDASVPFSLTAHAKDIFHESVSHDALDRLIRDAAFVVTVSEYNVHHLQSVCRSARVTPIHRIYNGIDTLSAASGPDAPRAAERILGVGRLVEKKGFDVFIDAVALLHAIRPAVRATLIGAGRCEADLTMRIEKRGMGQVITMAGARSQDEVAAAMRTHTVLAVPCIVAGDGDRDGLPTVITEAMAAWLPVVATPVTGIPEIVRHGETGLLVPERNPFALAEALNALLDQPALRLRLAASGRQLVEREFDARRNARGLAELFEGASTAGAASTRPQADALEVLR